MTKEKLLNFITNNKDRAIVFILLAVGVAVRLYNFGSVPSGFNQDEAYAAYNAWSILNYGVDSFGYHNPCYFIAWGSGMNVLESYLAIPFFWLFGCSEFVFRLPQLIISLVSLVVFYLTLKEIFPSYIAKFGLFILVISPWHIMISRWGLESNMAPHFILFGFYFFVKGVKNHKYWILSAVMFGASLYAYSITWVVVPLIVVVSCIYVVASKKKEALKYGISAACILFVLALPLILFLLVNSDLIPEISTSFISIPKLLVMRNGEMRFENFGKDTFKTLYDIMILQDDGEWYNTTKFGLYYQISIPFMAVGFISLIVFIISKWKRKEFSSEFLILWSWISAVTVCLFIISANVNRTNCLHYFTIMLISVGGGILFGLRQKWAVVIKAIIIGAYLVCFIMFTDYYFTDYTENTFSGGYSEAVEYVKDGQFENVYVDFDICFAHILFADRTPYDVWSETVVYNNYPSMFMNVRSFANYTFTSIYPDLDDTTAFILEASDAYRYQDMGYEIKYFEDMAVVHR